MAEVLILVEHADGAPKKVTYELLAAAKQLGEPAAVVAATPGTAAGLTDALTQHGAEKIYVAESADIDEFLVAPKAEVLAGLVAEKSPAAVLIAATGEGKEIAGRLAVKIGSGVITDAVGLA